MAGEHSSLGAGLRADRRRAGEAWQDGRVTRAELEAWTSAVNLVVSEASWTRLERLVGLWQQYGRAMSLVGTTDREVLWEHVQEGLQCVACAEQVEAVDERCCWVDVGSGGGLPGLIVAAVRPCAVILFEPRERRAAFLELGLAAVGWGKGRVIRRRWDRSTWTKEVVGGVGARDEAPFFVLSARAVFAPEEWLRRASEMQFPRGIVLCHVDLESTKVGDESPTVVVRGSRWGVMGFSRKSG
jgi:16S rRNA G527 N7-methylase RsmG